MNICGLLEEFWDKETKKLDLNPADEIIAGCLLAADGQIRDERFR